MIALLASALGLAIGATSIAPVAEPPRRSSPISSW